jgi:hypothetical protein
MILVVCAVAARYCVCGTLLKPPLICCFVPGLQQHKPWWVLLISWLRACSNHRPAMTERGDVFAFRPTSEHTCDSLNSQPTFLAFRDRDCNAQQIFSRLLLATSGGRLLGRSSPSLSSALMRLVEIHDLTMLAETRSIKVCGQNLNASNSHPSRR